MHIKQIREKNNPRRRVAADTGGEAQMSRRMRTQTNMPTILIYTLCSHVISKFNVIDSFDMNFLFSNSKSDIL